MPRPSLRKRMQVLRQYLEALSYIQHRIEHGPNNENWRACMPSIDEMLANLMNIANPNELCIKMNKKFAKTVLVTKKMLPY